MKNWSEVPLKNIILMADDLYLLKFVYIFLPISLPFDAIQRFASVFDFVYFSHICLGVQHFFLRLFCSSPTFDPAANIATIFYAPNRCVVLNFGERWIHTNHLTEMVYFTIYRNMSECVWLHNMCLQFRRCALFAKEMSKRRLKGGFFVCFLAPSLPLSLRLPLCFPSYFGMVAWLVVDGDNVRMWVCVYYVDCGKSATLYVCISLYQLDNGKRRTYNQSRNETKCDGWSTFGNPTIYTIHIVLALPPSYCLPRWLSRERIPSEQLAKQKKNSYSTFFLDRLHRKILKSGLLYGEKLWEKIGPFKELRSQVYIQLMILR